MQNLGTQLADQSIKACLFGISKFYIEFYSILEAYKIKYISNLITL
jgi:hypothetical protein